MYFGEDYSAFEGGTVSDTEGTGVVDDKTPTALIMPAHPRVGDVYRPENVPEVVFEEVRVDKVDMNERGPSGNISGAMEVNELHMDGTQSQMNGDMGELTTAVDVKDWRSAQSAALRVAENELDLRLLYQRVIDVDLARIALWADQLPIDAAADNTGAVLADVVALERIWERTRHGVESAGAVDAALQGYARWRTPKTRPRSTAWPPRSNRHWRTARSTMRIFM